MKVHALAILGLTLLVVSSGISAVAGDTYLVLGGEFDHKNVIEGESVTFAGTIWSNSSSEGELVFMNVSLSAPGSEDPEITLSKEYDPNFATISGNQTFTDTLSAKMDYDPGTYNVTISFDIRDDSHDGVPVQTYVVLTNQTLTIVGVSSQQGIVLGIFIGTIVVAVGLVVYMLRTNRR